MTQSDANAAKRNGAGKRQPADTADPAATREPAASVAARDAASTTSRDAASVAARDAASTTSRDAASVAARDAASTTSRDAASVAARGSSLERRPVAARCADGWELRGELVTDPATPPRAIAIVGHAMMVDRRTLDRRRRGLVSHLAARGIAALAVDLRGHGESGPRAEDGGDWSYDDFVEQDVPALVQLARAQLPSLPCVAIGHSLFAHVALARVARHPETPLDALVLLACNVSHPGWHARPLARLTKGALIEVTGVLARVAGRLPARRLRQGSDDEARSYVSDFVRGWRTGQWRARDGFDYFAALPSLTRPVLAIVGAGDRLLSPPEDARSLVAPIAHADFRVVGRATGLPFDPGHMELVLDERARPAWDEVARFVLDVASRV
jgi:pimeloyl-ACP methyl ester carboxylesterase